MFFMFGQAMICTPVIVLGSTKRIKRSAAKKWLGVVNHARNKTKSSGTGFMILTLPIPDFLMQLPSAASPSASS
jgi:hypothetical protein